MARVVSHIPDKGRCLVDHSFDGLVRLVRTTLFRDVPYSSRSTSTGDTRVARRTGSTPAARLTITRAAALPT